MMMNDFLGELLRSVEFESESRLYEGSSPVLKVDIFKRDKTSIFIASFNLENKELVLNFTSSFQAKLYDWLSRENKGFDIEMGKNSYFLLAIDEELKNEYPTKTFINIEEDAYFFKKFIFSYSDLELERLQDEIAGGDLLQGIQELVSDQEVFERFSTGSDLKGYERILYQIFVKIPAIELPRSSKDFEDLSSSIQNEVEAEGLSETHDTLTDSLSELELDKINIKDFTKILGQL